MIGQSIGDYKNNTHIMNEAYELIGRMWVIWFKTASDNKQINWRKNSLICQSVEWLTDVLKNKFGWLMNR